MTEDAALPFGALVRRYRLQAGLTQEQLAERASLSTRAVGELERDSTRLPRPDTTTFLADALGLQGSERAAFIAAARPEAMMVSPTSAPSRMADLLAPELLAMTLTPLLGREHEEAAVTHLLGQARLLTLTGTGGVGKTRLALHVATQARARYSAVHIVSLAAVRDPALVLGAVGSTLGVSAREGVPLLRQVVGALEGRSALLVLDNFEQVLAARTDVLALLSALPALTVLVTSRRPLQVRGEQEFAAPPLGVPPTWSAQTAEAVAQAPAVQLFMQRARAIRPDLALADVSASLVAAICQRLDGLPLAIELAATQMRLFSLATLLARLSRRLSLQGEGATDRPDRQRTMRDTIAWSYELLDTGDRTLFRRLAVFVGGAPLAAIDAVCGEEHTADDDSTLGLERLAMHSLLQVREDATGQLWMTLLETIREYALERLGESGEMESIRRRHGMFYLEWAEQAQRALHGPAQATWMSNLEQDLDNLRAAIQWTRDAGAVETGLRIVSALSRYWELRGHQREALGWLENLLLDIDEEEINVAVRARARVSGGILAYRLARYGQAASWLEQGRSLYQSLGDLAGLTHALNNLGNVALDTGDAIQAAAYFDETVSLQRALGDRIRLASALNNLAEARRHQGRTTEAESLFAQSLALYEEAEDTWSIASVMNNLGTIALDQKDYARATALYERSLALRQELGNQQGVALVLSNLAQVALAHGDRQRAAELYGQSLDIHRQLDSWVGIAICFQGLAAVAVAAGQDERGAALWGVAMALRDDVGAPLLPTEEAERDRALANLRRRLGDDATTRALTKGRMCPLTQAVYEATTIVNS